MSIQTSLRIGGVLFSCSVWWNRQQQTYGRLRFLLALTTNQASLPKDVVCELKKELVAKQQLVGEEYLSCCRLTSIVPRSWTSQLRSAQERVGNGSSVVESEKQ